MTNKSIIFCSYKDRFNLSISEERAEVSPDVQWQKLIMDLFKYLILQNVTADDILGNIGTLLSMGWYLF